MEKEERHPEEQYLDILRDIMENGHEKTDYASGKKIKSVFGRQIRFDLSKGFPLLTTKKMFLRGIIHELLWFLRGDTNVKTLIDDNVHIWDAWAYRSYEKAMKKGEVPELLSEEFVEKMKESDKDSEFVKKWGELGPVYGRQWRKWQASDGRIIDQLKWAIWKTKNYPDRKHVLVSAWNPEFIYEMSKPGTDMAIPPCHVLFNINVTNGKLSLQLYQRSCDAFLGVPFNIASYSLITLILAQVCGYEPGEFIHTYGDIHVYEDQYEQVKEQISRKPMQFPKMKINLDKKEIDDFVFEDFTIEDYKCHPTIKAPLTIIGGFDEKERGEFEKNREDKED